MLSIARSRGKRVSSTATRHLSLTPVSRLSAYLYELTKNSTYLAAAEQTAIFVRAQLYNGAVILDTMNMTDCSRDLPPASFDSGFYIDALSVLSGANSSWTPLSVSPTSIFATSSQLNKLCLAD